LERHHIAYVLIFLPANAITNQSYFHVALRDARSRLRHLLTRDNI
jgi:hypothetical protein